MSFNSAYDHLTIQLPASQLAKVVMRIQNRKDGLDITSIDKRIETILTGAVLSYQKTRASAKAKYNGAEQPTPQPAPKPAPQPPSQCQNCITTQDKLCLANKNLGIVESDISKYKWWYQRKAAECKQLSDEIEEMKKKLTPQYYQDLIEQKNEECRQYQQQLNEARKDADKLRADLENHKRHIQTLMAMDEPTSVSVQPRLSKSKKPQRIPPPASPPESPQHQRPKSQQISSQNQQNSSQNQQISSQNQQILQKNQQKRCPTEEFADELKDAAKKLGLDMTQFSQTRMN